MNEDIREISADLDPTTAPIIYPHVTETLKRRVLDLYESQNALSAAFGLTRQAIWARVKLAGQTDKIHSWWERTLLLPHGCLAETNNTGEPFVVVEEAADSFALAISRLAARAYITCAARWEDAYRTTSNRRPRTYNKKKPSKETTLCPHCGGMV